MFNRKSALKLKRKLPSFIKVLRDDFCLTMVDRIGAILTIRDTTNGYLVQRFNGKLKQVATFDEAVHMAQQEFRHVVS